MQISDSQSPDAMVYSKGDRSLGSLVVAQAHSAPVLDLSLALALSALRAAHRMPVSRFSRLAGIPERTYRRRLARHRAGDPSKGPWPVPKVDDIEATAAKYAVDWPAWGHRKIAAMMRTDGHQVSTSTVQRALRRRGLLLPTGSGRPTSPSSKPPPAGSGGSAR